MGIMHREVIRRRRDITIVGSIVFISLMIGLATLVGDLKIKHLRIERVTDPIFLVVTVLVILLEIKKLKISYKYSIIADQLIIHKMQSENQETLENIKLNNIVFLGDNKERNNIKTNKEKYYTCNILRNRHTYCCIYKNNDEYRKFYFQPSNKLVEKLKKAI